VAQKKEWSFKEFWNVIEKFNEIAETGSYSSLADIYKKLAEEFKCTEEDVLSGFNSLVDDYDQLVKTFEGMRQLSLDTTPDEVIDTLSQEFGHTKESVKDMLDFGIENSIRFLIALQRWKKFLYERFNN
jgi:hypothetical protein